VSSPIAPLYRALGEHRVRYLLIGVSGANLYVPVPGTTFVTLDYDLFLPLDPTNLLETWSACERVGLDLWLRDEPSRPSGTNGERL
jgi:hypothetical protein